MKTIESPSERRFLRRLLAGNGSESPAAVVLIGSFARGSSASQNSDVDPLVIGGERPTHAPARFQIMRLTADELRDRVSAGDDLAQWALRFGVPISGRHLWSRLRDQLLPDAPWPVTELAPSEARNTIASATSSGVPLRPAGVCSPAITSEGSWEPVAIHPGCTALRGTLARAPSLALA